MRLYYHDKNGIANPFSSRKPVKYEKVRLLLSEEKWQNRSLWLNNRKVLYRLWQFLYFSKAVGSIVWCGLRQ